MKTLTCNACGKTWPASRGHYRRRFCDDCLTDGSFRSGTHNKTKGYDLALSTVNLRLAVEEATAALEMGRPADALAALYRVESPTRSAVEVAACGAICERTNHAGEVFDRVVCYLPPNHYFADRHEGSAAGVNGFQWDDVKGTLRQDAA